jgi:hypothetical protein
MYCVNQLATVTSEFYLVAKHKGEQLIYITIIEKTPTVFRGCFYAIITCPPANILIRFEYYHPTKKSSKMV